MLSSFSSYLWLGGNTSERRVLQIFHERLEDPLITTSPCGAVAGAVLHSASLETFHCVVEGLVNIGVGQRPRTQLQPEIHRSEKQFDHHTGIYIWAQEAIPSALFNVGDGYPSSWYDPFFPDGGGKFGTELGLGNQCPDKRPVLATVRLGHRTHV